MIRGSFSMGGDTPQTRKNPAPSSPLPCPGGVRESTQDCFLNLISL